MSLKPEKQPSTQAVSTTNTPIAPSQTMSVSYLPPSSTYSPSTVQVTESVSYIPPVTQMTTSMSYLPSSTAITSAISTGSTPESVSYLPPDTSTKATTTTLSSSVSSTVPSPQNGKSECTKEGFFPDPDNCRKFYRCVQGQSGYQKYEFECGSGTAWDQSIQTCNYIEKVAACSIDSNEIDQGLNSSTSDSELPIMSSSTTVSSQTTATTSSSTVPISIENTITASTPSEMSTESTTSETDKTEASSTIIATSISINEKEDSSGRPEEIQMPGSSSTESSSESSSESLSTSESNEESSSPTESHVPDCTPQKPSNAIVCNDEGFYPHPIRCDKFYRCVNNGNGFNVYHFDCAPGTIFDSSINTCNYPESVYPARDCTTGNTTSSNVESTTQSGMPEQSTSMEITTTQSTTQQTEESTSTKLDTTTLSMETTSEGSITASGVELTTSNIPESTESMTESMNESTTATIEATDSSTPEQTTESTTEATTSTESGTSTTESQEQPTTESQSTTESQEQSTTESQEQSTIELEEPSSTEAQEQSTTELQEQSTTESQEQTTTELSESTTAEPAVAAPCAIGNLTDEQITLVCPTGFRRHPKYCNLFYQCTSEGNMEIKILVLSCPENTIFDEKKIQCLPANKSSQPCMGTRISARFYRRLENNALSPVSTFNQLIKTCKRKYSKFVKCIILGKGIVKSTLSGRRTFPLPTRLQQYLLQV